MRRTLTYIHNVREIRGRQGPKPGLFQLAFCFLPWWRSFREHDILGRHALPWITLPAVQFLKQCVRPQWRVFEFGSGASTIFFGLRCSEVYSVEYDVIWAEKVELSLRRLGISSCRLRYIPPDTTNPADDDPYGSRFPGYEQSRFEIYAKSIDEHPDGSLDLVFVDGRSRDACIRHATRKVRPGGMLILDNTERARYRNATLQIPKTWYRRTFPGPCARTEFFTETTIWIAPGVGPNPR